MTQLHLPSTSITCLPTQTSRAWTPIAARTTLEYPVSKLQQWSRGTIGSFQPKHSRENLRLSGLTGSKFKLIVSESDISCSSTTGASSAPVYNRFCTEIFGGQMAPVPICGEIRLQIIKIMQKLDNFFCVFCHRLHASLPHRRLHRLGRRRWRWHQSTQYEYRKVPR